MNTDSIAIKGGVLVFGASFGAGRKLYTLSTGVTSPLIISLLSILLIPAILVFIYCIYRLIKTAKKPISNREKRSEIMIPAAYILSIISGLIIGFISHNPA